MLPVREGGRRVLREGSRESLLWRFHIFPTRSAFEFTLVLARDVEKRPQQLFGLARGGLRSNLEMPLQRPIRELGDGTGRTRVLNTRDQSAQRYKLMQTAKVNRSFAQRSTLCHTFSRSAQAQSRTRKHEHDSAAGSKGSDRTSRSPARDSRGR